jgi:RNA polymerase sigma-70 factor (ECF subfamily)
VVGRPQLALVKPPPARDERRLEEPALDTTDLDAVFRRFAPYVARVAMRVLGPHGEVDDLVQDVFLDAHRGLRSLREVDAVKGWLATVTVRKARRRLRRQRVLALIGLDAPIDPDLSIDPSRSPEERALITSAYRVLDEISSDARIAWVLRCLEGEPLERVAEVLGISRATAHRRVREAQEALEGAFGDA